MRAAPREASRVIRASMQKVAPDQYQAELSLGAQAPPEQWRLE